VDDASSKISNHLEIVSNRVSSAILTGNLQPKIIQEADVCFKSYVELLGYCAATKRLQTFLLAGHYMLGEFDVFVWTIYIAMLLLVKLRKVVIFV
jgi:hypothetical protein